MTLYDTEALSEGKRRLMRRGWRPAPPAQRPVLFINPRSGDGAAVRANLAEHADRRGIQPVVLEPQQDLPALVRHAVEQGADALGMAGGDGSLAQVAAVAAAEGLPFVCVPAGTRNHFALDLGVDRRDLVGSLEAFGDAMERRVDLGQAGGRVFLNNVSLGVYGEAVQHTAYRDAKARTLLATAERVLGPSGWTAGLALRDDAGRQHSHLAVVLVSNNPYALAGPGAGSRPSLTSGRLGILVLDTPEEKPPPARAWSALTFEVLAAGPVAAGVDGEAITLDPPVRFLSRPGVLRVRLSPRHPGVSPAARVGFRPASPGLRSAQDT